MKAYVIIIFLLTLILSNTHIYDQVDFICKTFGFIKYGIAFF